MEGGRHIRLAAEVGLLTRNIQIQGDTPCRGRLLVGSFRKSSVEEFSGKSHLKLLSYYELDAMGPSEITIVDIFIYKTISLE